MIQRGQRRLQHCTLAHGIAVAGHDLTAGARIHVCGRMPLAGRLARAELLFGVLWQAGTVLHSTSEPRTGAVSLRPPRDQVVQVPGTEMHGKVRYEVGNDGSRSVYAGCPDRDQPREPDGYVTSGAGRHSRGRQAYTGSSLQWDDYRQSD